MSDVEVPHVVQPPVQHLPVEVATVEAADFDRHAIKHSTVEVAYVQQPPHQMSLIEELPVKVLIMVDAAVEVAGAKEPTVQVPDVERSYVQCYMLRCPMRLCTQLLMCT